MRYNLPESLRRELRERGGDPDEVLGTDFPSKDFPVKFARDLVAKVPHGKRLEQVRAAKQLIDDTRTQRARRRSAPISSSSASTGATRRPTCSRPRPGAPPPNVDVKLETDKPSNEVERRRPDEPQGDASRTRAPSPLYRLAAVTKSDNGLYDNKELVIGKLEPGKTKTAIDPARLVRGRGPQGRLDGAAPEGRAARLQDPDATRSRARTASA